VVPNDAIKVTNPGGKNTFRADIFNQRTTNGNYQGRKKEQEEHEGKGYLQVSRVQARVF